MLHLSITPPQLEAALAARELKCPDCSGPLSPWGFARPREIRLSHDEQRPVRPRRTQCRQCAKTHVICPSWTVPRRRDGAEVIGQALLMAAQGAGHRTIARRLRRPPGTVRGWLRAGRRRAEGLRECATRWACGLDWELCRIEPADSALGDAVEAIAVAVVAWVLRFGPTRTGPWELAVGMTGGLLHGQPPLPP
jgi:hypothetical protein